MNDDSIGVINDCQEEFNLMKGSLKKDSKKYSPPIYSFNFQNLPGEKIYDILNRYLMY